MKKISILLTGILICVCILSTFFSVGCLEDYDDTKSTYYYDQDGVQYVCNRETNIAIITGIKMENFNPEGGIWVIPEKLSNGMVVTTFREEYTRFEFRYYSGIENIIKKIYFPYTFNNFLDYELFYGETSSFTNEDGEVRSKNEFILNFEDIVVPCVDAKYAVDYMYGFMGGFNVRASMHMANFYKSTGNVILSEKHIELLRYDMDNNQYDYDVDKIIESLNHDLYTPNYIFHFNYEDAPNENIYWIDRIEDENTLFVLPTDPIRDGYEFGGWYTEETCENEWDKQMLPTESVKHFYAKWVEKAE